MYVYIYNVNIDLDCCIGKIPCNENVCDNHSFVDRKILFFIKTLS